MAKRSTGINQTAISFKCDTENLEKLNVLCDKLACNRNKLLNFLVSYAISNLSEPNKLILTSIYSTIKI